MQTIFVMVKCELGKAYDVADAASDQESLKASFFEPVQHAQGVGGNIGPRNRVFGARNDARRTRRRGEIRIQVQINLDLA